MNASVDGAPQVGWMMAQQERDITHRVFFDAYLKMKYICKGSLELEGSINAWTGKTQE